MNKCHLFRHLHTHIHTHTHKEKKQPPLPSEAGVYAGGLRMLFEGPRVTRLPPAWRRCRLSIQIRDMKKKKKTGVGRCTSEVCFTAAVSVRLSVYSLRRLFQYRSNFSPLSSYFHHPRVALCTFSTL